MLLLDLPMEEHTLNRAIEIQFFPDSHTDVGRRNATGVKAMVHCADAAAKTDTNAKLDFRRDDD